MTQQENPFGDKVATYLICLNERCARRDKCLRWVVGQHVTGEQPISRLFINPKNALVKEGKCPVFRSAKPLKMPLGMKSFYHDMPRWQEKSIKDALIERFSRTAYYRYHNGTKPITPEIEKEIRRTCKAKGWTKQIHFDGYIEDYQW